MYKVNEGIIALQNLSTKTTDLLEVKKGSDCHINCTHFRTISRSIRFIFQHEDRIITDAGVYMSKNGSFIYIQSLKDDNDYLSGIELSESLILISHSHYNRLSMYKWSPGYTYQLVFAERCVIGRSPVHKDSGLTHMRHAYFGNSPYHFFSIVGKFNMIKFELDIVTVEQSKKLKLKI